MATRDGAAVAKLNTGLVAKGKSADFIVLDANPLENIANTRRINKVYLRGAEVDRAGIRAKWQAKWGKWKTNKPAQITTPIGN
jgi:cytosine/adenosine deaminase-related metal-dependent hydrolase